MKLRSAGRRGAAVILVSAVTGAIAWACADPGYEMSWNPEESPALITPGNDTRANYILLMADRDGTIVADPRRMTTGLVPVDFPYAVMRARLEPPREGQADYTSYEKAYEGYGLSEKPYEYSSDLGLCHSNRRGAKQFVDALNADASVSSADRATLTDARTALANACDKAATLPSVIGKVVSPAGSAFAQYLDGSRLFYAEDFEGAKRQFSGTTATRSPWLVEARAYMRFRTALTAAMRANFDEWGGIKEPAKRDLVPVRAAAAIRADYLKAYPHGRYTASARDLGRRLAWMEGDEAALGKSLSEAFATRGSQGAPPDLATMDEVDTKYLPSNDGAGITDPLLLAVVDLMRLRPTQQYDEERSHDGRLLTRAELERQRPLFAANPDLHSYLLALEAFHNRQQPREVLALIPDSAHQKRFSYLQFSRQMLRGFALEAVKDVNARAFWLTLLPGATQPYQREAVELTIYRHDRDAGAIGRLFETGSPLLSPLIRQHAIEEDAGPALLRQQAKAGITAQQRDVALYLLLANELHHGQYREYLADQPMAVARAQAKEDGYAGWQVGDYDPTYNDTLSPPPLGQFGRGNPIGSGCPNLHTVVTALAANGSAVRPRLCLAEFFRGHGFDGWNDRYDERAGSMVQRSRNGFRGTPITRADIYRSVLASPAASADDKAFALNRAIRCYQPSGYNSCGGDDASQATRKAWFQTLKTRYGNTSWAKELKYYW